MQNPNPVEIVKRQLWRNGVKAKDVSGSGLGFDLLVNGTHKVKVMVDTGRKAVLTAPRGIILAVVKEGSVEYMKCRGGTCTTAQGITKLFSI